jgi:hypothetical protein
MELDIIVYLIVLIVFTTIILKILKKKHDSHKEEDEEAEHEIEEYEEQTIIWQKEHQEEDEGDEEDRRDIYNNKAPKNKNKKSYQPKNYRGTDIEVAGFESAADQKALRGETLTDEERQEFNKEIEKDKIDEGKPVETPKMDPETLKSGIASIKSALEKMMLEVKENYNATGVTSARDNRRNSVDDVKERAESKSREPKNKDFNRGD